MYNASYKTTEVCGEILRNLVQAETIEQIEEIMKVAEHADKEGLLGDVDYSRLLLVKSIALSALRWKDMAWTALQTTP